MALIVEDGTGLQDANSYATMEFADQYNDEYGNEEWAAATIDEREEALRIGTRDLDLIYGLRWKGRRKTQYQALDWPRTGVYDADNYYVDENSVPLDIQRAAIELGLRHIQGLDIIPDIPGTGTGIKKKRVKAGPVEDETEYFGPATPAEVTLFPAVDSYVSQYIESAQLLERS